MAKQKACKICNKIYTTAECPNCGAKESTETIKGRIYLKDSEKSEIAKKLNLKGKGDFAIKTR